jgi:hypothetical protein
MKICRVGAKLFNTDGWKDMMKLMVSFRNFTNAPQNHRHIDRGSVDAEASVSRLQRSYLAAV